MRTCAAQPLSRCYVLAAAHTHTNTQHARNKDDEDVDEDDPDSTTDADNDDDSNDDDGTDEGHLVGWLLNFGIIPSRALVVFVHNARPNRNPPELCARVLCLLQAAAAAGL